MRFILAFAIIEPMVLAKCPPVSAISPARSEACAPFSAQNPRRLRAQPMDLPGRQPTPETALDPAKSGILVQPVAGSWPPPPSASLFFFGLTTDWPKPRNFAAPNRNAPAYADPAVPPTAAIMSPVNSCISAPPPTTPVVA